MTRQKDTETLVAVVGPTEVEKKSKEGWRLTESIPSSGSGAPFFVMEKGPETRLSKLQQELDAAKKEAGEARRSRYASDREVTRAQESELEALAARERLQADADAAEALAKRESELRRKMEADMGKIRRELGEKVFREALEGDNNEG